MKPLNQNALKMAKTIALFGLRNTYLEEIHSKGLIIDDEQMKILMKDVMNKLYKLLNEMENIKSLKDEKEFQRKYIDYAMKSTYMWDDPDTE